jgi:cytosine/adenosine deaminase-related metal-dependent hydrolase
MNGPTAITAREVLDAATRGGARCLGWEDETGHLTPGACADLVIWTATPEAMAGALSDPVEAWLRCGPQHADTTIVAGRVLVSEGRLAHPGHSDILTTHRRIATELQNV